ncbi:hypothetical protein CAOG_05072 [Capsaspora owczarzaki ATCC 30864]|uniref:LIM zinc-binding domain-containing protein n=1 Tax=Capsaspora owczarzaki (strain ATCC 30864) TaxID=595528 RepID=A0A0D2X3J7_CAPO3|nr:hypothetical protein CAOG_05072 [Capsaspora owczarzaki ATCC 30864]KJE94429.1 hypothetical protein CAOG_005072 [Capsaspora owczarzaki ATCC 30864]|eukprot:XP_004346757.1 hypothetical protein CAOG_05072 [Capsaspora owczarzaki ATCC 30864]
MDEVDNLLSDLTSQMSSVGIAGYQGKCTLCKQNIINKGTYVEASGLRWHKPCFVCSDCKADLTQDGYYELNKKLYCKTHYVERSCDKCATCNQPISDQILTALGGQYHPECFKCVECQSGLHGKTYFGEAFKSYCEPCYHKKFAPKCAACSKDIIAAGENSFCVRAFDNRYHSECYKCVVCSVPFSNDEGKGAIQHKGQLYCKTHYQTVSDS